ncbi:outer membrane beta-barrel protein [Mariniflexile jejuense]|uniref:Outer membrane beta-barrel protein n=1 Tax=Mariniflexile jejuense TaxID=1173582 RepID=A0ABW3JFZ0_9FLAO
MKKEFYIVFLITIFNLSSTIAQINLKIGVNIGGQVSSLRGIEYETDNKFDIVQSVGVNLELGLSQSVSIVTSVNFERWKKSIDIYYNHYSNESKEGYDFFNVPLFVRYKFGGQKKYFLDTGGFMNYYNKGQPNGIMPLFIEFEDYNFGLAFGTGIVFHLNESWDITIQVRDDIGLSNINKYENQISGNIKTNTIRLIGTLNFKI